MRKTIKFALKEKALDGITDNHSKRVYTKGIERFSCWCKENDINNLKRLERAGASDTIQQYERYLESSGYSSATIHTYLAPVCKGLDVPMSDIDKPLRASSDISRGRGESVRGSQEALSDKYRRLVEAQECIGIRRSELTVLTGKDLKTDENGYMCVHVVSGKGGKEQYQRILPEYQDKVRELFGSVEENERLFKAEEMENHINLHGIRANVAKEAYNYYVERMKEDPEYREQLKQELVDRWNEAHREDSRAFERYCKEMEGKWYLRGDNRAKAEEQGLPTCYDKTALLAVSVFHLSHYRNNVTVTNYMLT